LIFWVQCQGADHGRRPRERERLKSSGKLAAFSLSTHNRPLAIEAMEAGWDPVMVRHSAAHRGAEQHIFPRAAAGGASVMTFNNTCYGRLLEPLSGLPPVRPSDCYRYTLLQPAVRCCWTAPATLQELEENLDVLRDPTLPEDRLRLLLAQGERLYREETTFRRLVRAL
jgi:aryl-alcohol dehydrogenase-like predicted oxidoreductase